MRIACPNCETSYDVAADALGEAGRAVRCARCLATWFAAAAEPELAFQTVWGVEPELADLAPTPSAAVAEDLNLMSTDAAVALEASADDPGPAQGAEGPPLVPMLVEPIPEAPPAAAAQEDVETVAARRAPPARAADASRRRPGVATVVLGLTAAIAALIAGRTQVVSVAPQTAALYARIALPVNLRGLSFGAVKVSGQTQDGVPVLVIDGAIVNVAPRPTEVPRLRFAIRNQTGVEVYAWTALPERSVLPAGDELAFRTRLASPPTDAHDVQVRFFNRRDLEATR